MTAIVFLLGVLKIRHSGYNFWMMYEYDETARTKAGNDTDGRREGLICFLFFCFFGPIRPTFGCILQRYGASLPFSPRGFLAGSFFGADIPTHLLRKLFRFFKRPKFYLYRLLCGKLWSDECRFSSGTFILSAWPADYGI